MTMVEKQNGLASFLVVAILITGILTYAGCSPRDELTSGSSDRQTRVVMNVLSIFYGEYLESHRGKPPQDSIAFRQYLESQSDGLKRYKIENPDQLMKSPRDGQPLIIVCGKRIAPADSPGTPWAAYEQTGIDDKRMAVRVRGGVHELGVSEIAKIFDAQ